MSSTVAVTRGGAQPVGRPAALDVAERGQTEPRLIASRDLHVPLAPRRRSVHLRRWRLASLLLAGILPTALMGVYLYQYAADQYVTEFRFSVRHQAPLRVDASTTPPMTTPLGGAGSPLTVLTDSQIVVQYLKSRQVVDDIIAAGVDLDKVYAGSDTDFLAHLRPASSIEERQRYWRRMVDPFFDMSTGIVSVEVRAFRPADAQLVATKALMLAEKLVNDMANRAHADVVTYAAREAAESGARLKSVQASLADYRNKNAVLFPEMQATADSTMEGKVEETLIEAKTTYSTQLAQGVARDTVQMTMLRNRIAALEAELRTLHGRQAKADGGGLNGSLASVMSGYNALQTDEQIASKVYERALISLQDARNEASQQSVYLAAFVHPGLPQESSYPVRWRVMVETALLSFVAWCLLQLIYHGVRDHID